MDKQRNPAGSVDLLHGSIMKSLIIFMIPVFVSNIFQQFYNVADTALVGHYLGENALAYKKAYATLTWSGDLCPEDRDALRSSCDAYSHDYHHDSNHNKGSRA